MIVARLDNYAALIKQLGSFRVHHEESTLILAAYRQWGKACVHHLQGAFSFAIWDQQQQQLFCARDRVGIYPFFYYLDHDKFLFSNVMKHLVRESSPQLTPNPAWVVDHVCRIWLDKEQTFYKEIQRLPPAHTLTISQQGVQLERYWDFDLGVEISLNSDDAYVLAARERFDTAVRRCLVPPQNIGIELSGGLDSTAIAAAAYAQKGHNPDLNLSTYSHAAPLGMVGKQDFLLDEREPIEQLRASANIQPSYFFTNEQATVLPLVSKAIALGGGVDRCDYTTFTSGIHALASRRGVQVLLSGWGGDQIVTSRLQTSRYLLRRQAWQQLWQELSLGNREPVLWAWQKLLRLIWSEYSPLPSFSSHKKTQQAQRRRQIEATNYMLRQQPRLLTYMAGVNWRERLNHYWALYDEPPTSFRAAQYRQIMMPKLTNRLEATAQMAATFGIEYRYPMLDVELMQFFLALPLDQKRRGGNGRFLFRRCIKNLIPDDLRWAKKIRRHMYPWLVHSLKNDLANDIPPVVADAPEEVQVGWHIAQAKRAVHRKYMQQI